MLCRRLNKIICTQSPIHNSSQHRNPTIVRSKCSWINNLVAALNTDPMSSYRLRLILRDLNVTRLWNAWFRMQLVSSMVKRCRRDRGVRDMLACFKQTILRPSRTFLLSATAAYNSNPSDGTPPCSRDITDAELEELTRAFDGVDELSRTTLFCQGCSHRLVIDKQHPGVKYCTCPDAQPPGPSADGWEPYMEADDVIIWRKEYKPGGLYAYKVYGRYKDLRASTFATIQVDGAYRRSWDDAVAALSLVEREANGVRAQSVLHWEVAWPRFFSNRDYVYIRRHAAFAARTRCLPHVEAIFSPDEPDPCAAERPSVHTPAKRRGMRDERRERAAGGAEGALNKVYVIISRSCTHPAVPAARSPIRVTEYWSDMVVRSIDGADKPGMEFVLTYYDEPAVGGLPSGVSAWATGRAAPSYLARMHAAARAYEAWSAAHTEEPDFEPFDVVAPTAPAAPAAPTAPAAPAVAPEAAKKPLLETPAVEVQPPQPRAEARDKSTQTDDIPQKDASTDTRKCKQRTMVSEVKAKEKPKADEAESDAEMGTCEPVKPKDECDGSTELLVSTGLARANSEGVAGLQLLARLSFPTVETKPYNMPSAKEIDPRKSYADEKFEKLQEYYSFMNGRMREPHNPTERREILESAQKKLFAFIDAHVKDLKRLLFAADTALMSMVLLKLNKKMDTSEAKIKSTQAKIPFGLYASPEFKCLGTSYYIASAHSQEDAQMILASERKPHCYTFRGAFAFSGFYHRHSETSYVGPHAEQFQAKDPSQGLYCHSDDNWSDAQCIYKINPREEFPESVEYEPKVSYWCGAYRYFIPATTDVRCIFSVFSMNFILRFGYDGVTYKSQDLSFMYQNGQVFYTDEPWAGMSCWNWACKWRHNQNQRGNEFFVN